MSSVYLSKLEEELIVNLLFKHYKEILEWHEEMKDFPGNEHAIPIEAPMDFLKGVSTLNSYLAWVNDLITKYHKKRCARKALRKEKESARKP